MIGAAVARRYATALLELGDESGARKAIVEEVARVADAYGASAELRTALENPLVAHEAKKAILSELADELAVSGAVKNTMLLLCDRRRLKLLPAVAQLLREMSDRRGGVLRAEVTTAGHLSEDYYARLQAQLERMTGKQVVIDRREDPSLIAGVVARIGDTVIDGSLRARLHELQNALMPS